MTESRLIVPIADKIMWKRPVVLGKSRSYNE